MIMQYLTNYLNKDEIENLLKKIADLENQDIASLIHLIDSLRLDNLIKTQEESLFLKRIKRNLILFVINKICSEKNNRNIKFYITKLINLVHDIFTDKNIEIYLSYFDNDEVIFNRLLDCIMHDKLIINAITCPDYSGSLIKEKNKEIWSFDFNDLGCKDGITAQRSYGFVIAIYKIANKYINHVSINHYLPTFEFIDNDGFISKNGHLSFAECVNKLKQSLEYIKQEYSKREIKVNTILSDSLIADKEFKIKKEYYYKYILNNYSDNVRWQDFIEKVINTRKKLYNNWLQLDGNYQNLQKIIYNQLAEYFVMAEVFTLDPDSIMLGSDSAIMSETYTFLKKPILYGKDKKRLNYIGS